jgi:glycosyltransferase involved in cell wall biosynthesis
MVSTQYPPMPGGVGRYTSNLTTALRKLGLEVLVVCNDKGNGDFYGLSPNNKENSQLLLKLVSEVNPDIIHIQFEPGLYGLCLDILNPKNTRTYIDFFYKINKKVPIVTTFHTGYKFSQWLGTQSFIRSEGRLGKLGIPLRLLVRSWRYFLNYNAFKNLIIEKLRISSAGIVFSYTMSNVLGGGNVIYHGAEPSINPRPSKEKARSFFSLPKEKRIALAVGFKTDLKDWDILAKMNLPENWVVVINSSKNCYNKENYKIKVKENNLNINKNTIIDLKRGFLDDESLSVLFYASDIVLLPYTAITASGVMFDALAHGLPFISTDLMFFKEFSDQGLGITAKRKPNEFSNAIKNLEKDYCKYIESVNIFKNNLKWEFVAKQHEAIYCSISEKNNRKNFK